LFILGERTGSLLRIFSLSISAFYILIFSHPSYSWFPCSILSHTAFFIRSVQCLCASWLCILCLYSVFLHPIRLEGSIFGGPYVFGGQYLFGGLFSRLSPGSSWHFRYQLEHSCVKNGAIDL
jgi:hypothetical protein